MTKRALSSVERKLPMTEEGKVAAYQDLLEERREVNNLSADVSRAEMVGLEHGSGIMGMLRAVMPIPAGNAILNEIRGEKAEKKLAELRTVPEIDSDISRLAEEFTKPKHLKWVQDDQGDASKPSKQATKPEPTRWR